MSISTSSLGGGGVFVPSKLSGLLEVSAGKTGTFLAIAPPSGERVMLDSLAAVSPSEVAISIRRGTTTVISNKTPTTDLATVDDFKVRAGGAGQSYQDYGGVSGIMGEVNETIYLSTSSTTVGAIRYSYQTGQIK